MLYFVRVHCFDAYFVIGYDHVILANNQKASDGATHKSWCDRRCCSKNGWNDRQDGIQRVASYVEWSVWKTEMDGGEE